MGTSVTHNTVMKMVEHIHNKGHHLYMDNFYTSQTLFTSLFHVGIGACGTLRCNRQGVPSSIKDPSTRLAKGDIITARSNGLLFLKWKDKRVVKVLTNLHDDSTISKRHRTSSATGGGVEEIIKPLAVVQYLHGWGR